MDKFLMYVAALVAVTIAIVFSGEAAGKYSGGWHGFLCAVAAIAWWLIASKYFLNAVSKETQPGRLRR